MSMIEDEAYEPTRVAGREITRAGHTVAAYFVAKRLGSNQPQQNRADEATQQRRPEPEQRRDDARQPQQQQPQPQPQPQPQQRQEQDQGLGR